MYVATQRGWPVEASSPARRVEASTKGDAIYRYLREGILDGTFAPSQTLSQLKLATSLGFSITPLREALRRLQAEGLVRVESSGVLRVAPLSRRELRELYAVRAELDPLAARLAATSATDEQLQELVAAWRGSARMSKQRRVEANRRFHQGLYAACGNAVLAELCGGLWVRTDRYRTLLSVPSLAADIEHEHADISAALLARDADRAGALVLAHTESARELIEAKATSFQLFERDPA
jgi:DNA-binding GntR family transcriptional regulator